MSFSAEIKDFVGAIEKGWKLATPSGSELAYREYKKDEDGRTSRQDQAEADAAGGLNASGRVPGYVIPGVEGEGVTGGARRTALPSFVSQGADPSWAKAISGIESGGRYDAMGPRHPKYGHAVGKYQVMESNIGPWSEEALGKRMSTQEFLNDPSAQDAVFRYKFGDYVKKYGNPQDAASAWHSGRPLAQATRAGARDSLGTSTVDYVNKFTRSLGQPAAIPAGEGSFGLGGIQNKRRASLDDDLNLGVTQFAADGGRVRSRQEIEEEIRQRATEDDPPSPPPMEEMTATTPGRAIPMAVDRSEPAMARRPYEDPPSHASMWETPQRNVAMDAPPADTPMSSPSAVIRATEPGAVPLPPQRPTDVGNRRGAIPTTPRQPTRQALPFLPQRPDDSQLYDSGAPLPGEGLTAGSDEPWHPRQMVKQDGIGEAIQAGLDGIGEFFGFSRKSTALPSARDDRNQAIQRFSRNEGAATAQEVRQVDQTIDPKRQLNPAERAMARLYGGYMYYVEKGEPERAKKYAASMMMYARQHVQTAGALAQEAINAGNVPMGARIIQEAHDEIPDGQSLKVQKITPQGVQYAVYDDNGEMTQQATASVNQLMQMATGMRNGSAWLDHMNDAKARSMTASQKARLKRDETDQDALTNFNSNQPDNDFLNSLTPEARDQYNRMSPRVQGQVFRRWKDEQAGRRSSEAAELRNAQAESRTLKAEKDATDQQEYAGHLDRIRDAEEALQAQAAIDPDDEAKVKPLREALDKAKGDARNWTTQDGGRAKYATDLTRQLRPGRGSAGISGAGVGSGAGSRGGGSKEERAAASLDDAALRAQRKAERTKDPADAKAAQLARANAAWGKRDSGELDAGVQSEVDGAIAQKFGAADFASLDSTKKPDAHDWSDAVYGIMRGDNGLSVPRALDFVDLAVKSGKVTMNDDGSFSFNGSRPVYLSPQAFQAIARLSVRARPKTEQATVEKRSPFEERAGARDLRERERGKAALGTDYREGMPRGEMQRRMFDKTVDDPRNGGVIPFGGT